MSESHKVSVSTRCSAEVPVGLWDKAAPCQGNAREGALSPVSLATAQLWHGGARSYCRRFCSPGKWQWFQLKTQALWKINSLQANLLKASSPNDQVTELLKSFYDVLVAPLHLPLPSAYVWVMLMLGGGEGTGSSPWVSYHVYAKWTSVLPLLQNLASPCVFSTV